MHLEPREMESRLTDNVIHSYMFILFLFYPVISAKVRDDRPHDELGLINPTLGQLERKPKWTPSFGRGVFDSGAGGSGGNPHKNSTCDGFGYP